MRRAGDRVRIVAPVGDALTGSVGTVDRDQRPGDFYVWITVDGVGGLPCRPDELADDDTTCPAHGPHEGRCEGCVTDDRATDAWEERTR